MGSSHRLRGILARARALWQQHLFPRAIVGYSLGLFLAMYFSAVFQAAQPVLLYVVPPTLAFPFMLARKRGVWAVFWRGTTTAHGSAGGADQILPHALHGMRAAPRSLPTTTAATAAATAAAAAAAAAATPHLNSPHAATAGADGGGKTGGSAAPQARAIAPVAGGVAQTVAPPR